MIHPDHLSSEEMSALLSESRALSASRRDTPTEALPPVAVRIYPETPPPGKEDYRLFRVVTAKGNPDDRNYQETLHGRICCRIHDLPAGVGLDLSVHVRTQLRPGLLQ